MSAVVICHRDPDASNDYFTFGEEVEIIVVDIDYGRMDLHDAEEFADWESGHRATAEGLRRNGFEDAAKHIENALTEARERYQS